MAVISLHSSRTLMNTHGKSRHNTEFQVPISFSSSHTTASKVSESSPCALLVHWHNRHQMPGEELRQSTGSDGGVTVHGLV